jgi:hypothetical protein
MKSWQLRSVFSTTACLNVLASSGMPSSYLAAGQSSRQKICDPAAHSHWLGHNDDVGYIAQMNGPVAKYQPISGP